MRWIGLVVLAIASAGCNSVMIGGEMTPQIQAGMDEVVAAREPTIQRLGVIDIVDQRTEEARKSKAQLSGGCQLGLARFGEDQMGSDRIARLERDLVAAFGDAAKGQKLLLRRYDIHYGGIVGSCPITLPQCAPEPIKMYGPIVYAPQCERTKMKAGWFDPADLERNTLPLIVEIEVSFGGRDYSATAAYAPPNSLVLPELLEPSGQRAMAKANQRLIAAVRNAAS